MTPICKNYKKYRICKSATLIACFGAVLAFSGCNSNNNDGPASQTIVARDIHRDTDAAIMHNHKGFDLIRKNKLDAAEKELRLAIDADSFYGPAHNNLGSVYYQQKKYYQAASEYQLAATLMPTSASPRSNLGLVWETIGKIDEAIKCYEEALEVQSDQTETIANLARAYVRAGRKDDKTRQALTDVVMKDSRPEWNNWARERLAFLGPMTTTAAGLQNTTQPTTQLTSQPDDMGQDDD